MQNFINVEAMEENQIFSKSKHIRREKSKLSMLGIVPLLAFSILKIRTLFLKSKRRSNQSKQRKIKTSPKLLSISGIENRFFSDPPLNQLNVPLNSPEISKIKIPLKFKNKILINIPPNSPKISKIKIPLKFENKTLINIPPNSPTFPLYPQTQKISSYDQQNATPIEQNSSIINFSTYFYLKDKQEFVVEFEQLRNCLPADSFENSVVSWLIDLIDQNSSEDPLIISLLKNKISFLKGLLIASIGNLLINLLTNMPIDTLASLLTNLSMHKLQKLFDSGILEFVIDFSRIHCGIDSDGSNYLNFPKNLFKNLLVNFPENIKKNLVINSQLKEMWSKEDQNLNSSEFSEIVTPPEPSLDLLLESIEKDQTEQSQKFFQKNKKKIIILCDACGRINLMEKLFENGLEKEEVYRESKELQHGSLKSIECLYNDKYNVEILNTSFNTLQYVLESGRMGGSDLHFLWRYIHNADNFNIVLIIFDLDNPYGTIDEQIFKWLFFFKTLKLQNIKAIIALITQKERRFNSFFGNFEETINPEKIKWVEDRIKKVIYEFKLEESIMATFEKSFIKNEKDVAELSSKIDRCIANEDTQNRG
jgi:hypothetical protein